jgi:hypothetical protein
LQRCFVGQNDGKAFKEPLPWHHQENSEIFISTKFGEFPFLHQGQGQYQGQTGINLSDSYFQCHRLNTRPKQLKKDSFGNP